MTSADHADMIDEIGRELGRKGVAGTLVIVGKSIELHSAGTPVSIEIEVILNQWPLLPPDMRRRKADDIARRLVGARRASREAEGDSAVVDAPSRARILGAVGGFFALLLAIGLVRFAIPRLTTPPKVEPAVPSEADTARAQRLARACDAVRDRIGQGSNFGPFALEGFVVELWLANKGGPPLLAHPAVTGLVASGKLAPTADEKLATVLGGIVEVTDGFDADTARRWTGWNAVTVVFRDGFGRAFFEEENRPRFLGLADRIASATGASHGALFARCAHQTAHDVGAWFRGPDLPGAAAAMIYEMGFFPSAKILDGQAIASLRVTGGEIDALRKPTSEIEDVIAKLVGTSGGSVTAGPPPSLQFSLAAPARAVAATRELARKMGMAATPGE